MKRVLKEEKKIKPGEGEVNHGIFPTEVICEALRAGR